MTRKLEQKDKELFHRCITSQLSRDLTRSKVYATECAEVRKIAKIVITSQIALERVIIRLDTIKSLEDILGQVYPIISVVRETKDRITNVIPDMAGELGQVNEILTDLSLETGEVEDQSDLSGPVNEEASKILKESGVIAEEMMKEKFPEPKMTQTKEQGGKISTRIILEGASGSNDLENTIYDYIKRNNGKISLSECAKEIGVSAHTVRRTVNDLVERGRIEIE
ncbi:hypothetical protein [[Eubacterium] cellulosolvens]